MECPNISFCKSYNNEDILCDDLHRHCIIYRRQKYYLNRNTERKTLKFNNKTTLKLQDIVLNDFYLGDIAPTPVKPVYPR
jgi:hypothetical protein